MITAHDTLTPPRWHVDPTPHRGHRPSGAYFSLGGVLTLSLLIGGAIAPRSAKADLTYSLANYPADQGNHTVSGSITTDGNIGSLTSPDIISWTITIDTTTFTSHDAGFVETFAAGINASATTLTIPLVLNDDRQLVLSSPIGDVAWDRDATDPRLPPLSTYLGDLNGTNIWDIASPSMGGTEPWVIASITPTGVPEPSTALVAVFGAVAFLARCWSRRREQQRQRAA
jgi:hypothetical protein